MIFEERWLIDMNEILEYPGSALLYILIVLIATGLIAIKTKGNWNIWLAIIIVSIIEGMRSSSVGIDTAGYINDSFIPLAEGNFATAYGEVGFRVICKMLLMLSGNSIKFTLFGVAFLTHTFILFRLRDFSAYASYSGMVFAYFCVHYISTMNGVGQYLASAIIFWSCRYLCKENYLKYLIGVAIACTIHMTSLIALSYLFIRMIAYSGKTATQRMRMLRLFLLLFIAMIILCPYLLTNTKLGVYFDTYLTNINAELNFGNVMPFKLSLYILLLIIFVKQKKQVQREQQQIVAYDTLKEVVIICIYAMLLEGLGAFYTSLNRLSQSFSLYEPVIAARNWKNINKRLPVSLFLQKSISMLLFLIAIYTFYYVLSGDGHSVMPYSWN